jgi:hypothetical protein
VLSSNAPGDVDAVADDVRARRLWLLLPISAQETDVRKGPDAAEAQPIVAKLSCSLVMVRR